MRILITGASGFIGRRLVARLAPHHEVWAMARTLPDSAMSPSFVSVRWMRHDFCRDGPRIAYPRQIDAAVHLAQSPHYRGFPEHATEVFAVSAAATLGLLDWAIAAGAKQFVLASTGGLYGSSAKPVREDDPLVFGQGGLGFYFASKRASEILVDQYAHLLATLALRLFFVYGPGQKPGMLLPRLVTAIRTDRPISLQGHDGILLNPIFIDDAVEALAKCIERGERGILNVAGPKVVSLRQIGDIIGQCVGCKPVYVVDERAAPQHLIGDIGKMSARLGAPRMTPAQGLARLCGASEPAAASA